MYYSGLIDRRLIEEADELIKTEANGKNIDLHRECISKAEEILQALIEIKKEFFKNNPTYKMTIYDNKLVLEGNVKDLINENDYMELDVGAENKIKELLDKAISLNI